MAATLHHDAATAIHDGWSGHAGGAAGHYETQLDTFFPGSHHTGLTDQFALPHVEYFGS